MKKYYKVITEKMGSIWEDTYTDKEEALKEARTEWAALSDYDKRNRAFYVLEAEDPESLDGDIIETFEAYRKRGRIIWKKRKSVISL